MAAIFRQQTKSSPHRHILRISNATDANARASQNAASKNYQTSVLSKWIGVVVDGGVEDVPFDGGSTEGDTVATIRESSGQCSDIR